MCGIVGMIGKTSPPTIREAMLHAQSQGKDSCGLIWEDSFCKYGRSFSELLASRYARGMIHEAARSPFWIGHTRQATHGKVCAKNAHPFLVRTNHGNSWSLGVHNGVISNWGAHAYKKEYVDSQIPLRFVAHEAYERLAELSGWAALVWFRPELGLFTYRWNAPLFVSCYKGRIAFSSRKHWFWGTAEALPQGEILLWGMDGKYRAVGEVEMKAYSYGVAYGYATKTGFGGSYDQGWEQAWKDKYSKPSATGRSQEETEKQEEQTEVTPAKEFRTINSGP